METVEYYNENDTDCYLLLLDASKAFDRVEYVKLFTTLRNRKICPIVLRLLMNMYVTSPSNLIICLVCCSVILQFIVILSLPFLVISDFLV